MKTKELIRLLQLEDPSGDLEVNVGGDDIYFVERLPGYYDGAYSILQRDDSKKPFWDITGITVTRSGQKVEIHTMPIRDLVSDMPDAIIILDDSLNDMQKDYYAAKVKKAIDE